MATIGADGYQKNLRAETEENKGMILKHFEEDGYHYLWLLNCGIPSGPG